MGERAGRGAAVDSVLNGVVTGVWYALPDLVASRRARGWLKAALLLGAELSRRWGGARAAHADDVDTADAVEGNPGASATESDLAAVAAPAATEPVIDADALGLAGGPSNRARAVAVAAVVVVVVGTVAGERAIHRWGERLTARGVRGAHTRIGVVAGVATGVGTWALARSLGGSGADAPE